MILDKIPHLAQVGPSANRSRNDCGPACVAMCVSGLVRPLTVDQASIDCGQVLNQYTGFTHLIRGLNRRGLDTVPRNQFQPGGKLTPKGIRGHLRNGNPVILLVHYDGLPYPKQDANFHGWHFVVAVGFDDEHIIINDPLFWGNREREGLHLSVTDEDIDIAMSYNTQNYPHQGLVVVNPNPPGLEPVEDDVSDWEALAHAAQTALDEIQAVLDGFKEFVGG